MFSVMFTLQIKQLQYCILIGQESHSLVFLAVKGVFGKITGLVGSFFEKRYVSESSGGWN